MAEPVFDEIVLPEQEEADPTAVEPMQFDELILPHASGQFEEIVIPPQPKTETEKALQETPREPPTEPSFDDELNKGNYRKALQIGISNLAKLPAKAGVAIATGGLVVPTNEELEKPLLSKELVDSAIDPFGKIRPDDWKTGALRGLGDVVQSASTPENIGMLAVAPQGRLAQNLIAGTFLGQSLLGTPEQWEEFNKAETTAEKVRIGVNMAAGVLLPGAALAHGAFRKAPVRPDVAPDAAAVTPEEAVPETPQGAEPAAAPEAVRPSSEAAAAREAEFQRMSSNLNELNKDQFLPDREAPATEPIGTTEAIAELERRNAPSTEPIIPQEPAGTKFPEPTEPVKPQGQMEPWQFSTKEEYAQSENPSNAASAKVYHAIFNSEVKRALREYKLSPEEARAKVGDSPSLEIWVRDLEQLEREFPGSTKQSIRRQLDAGEYVSPNVLRQYDIVDKGTAANPQVDTLNLARNRENTPDNLESQSELNPTSTKNATTEIMSPGPGAASARETLTSYELRRFGKRFQETEGIDPAIREATGNRYYEPISNKLTFEEAGRVIEERGTDEAIRLVRDENFAMEPRVRATLAQTLVTKLNQSHAEASAAGDAVRAKGFLDQAVDTAEYLGEFGTRLGQGVQSFAIWSKLTPEGMLESAKRSAKRANVDLTPEQMAEIRRLAAEAHGAKEGIPKQDATKKLADYMVKQTGIPAGDLPLSIYYTHILSGVQTHIVNAVDTGLNVFHEVNNLAVSNPRAAASIYAGLMRGLGEGKADGLLSLQEGRRIVSGKFIESPDLLEVSTFGKKGGVPIAVKGVVSKVARKVAESWPAKPLNTYKYVMRMMSASDAVFFRGAEEARAGLLAHRLAEATGVERAKLKAEVDSILGYDRLPEFRAEAAREGYTGAKAEARATELMIQSRPESLRVDASDYAGVSTYNHTPRGVLGYFANQIAQVSNKYPALKLFVPFTRIVANVTNRGLDNTPMGIMRALKEKGLSKEERQRVLTRGIMGTTGLIGLGVLNATGTIQVHGAGPSDPEKKRQLQSAGWKPFSIQVGDKYYTYTYTPIGLGVSVLGNYLDSQRYNELSQKDALTRTVYAMSRIGQTVFSQSFLSGLSNLFTILSGDPGRSVNSLKQFFSNVATAATTPNLFRDINHLFDPSSRKSEGFAQDLVRNIPIARLNLRPTLNAFGEPVILSRNRFFSGLSDDPAWRVVVNKNLRVPTVDQTTFVDSEDGYLYAKIAGERMRKYIVGHLTELNRANDQAAQDMLSKASRAMFDEARQDVVRHGGVKKKRKRG